MLAVHKTAREPIVRYCQLFEYWILLEPNYSIVLFTNHFFIYLFFELNPFEWREE